MAPRTSTIRTDGPVSSLGSRLKFRREQCGLSQTGLSRMSGVPSTTVTRLESGDRGAELENLLALAQALGCSGGWLVFGEGVLPPPPDIPDEFRDQRRRK